MKIKTEDYISFEELLKQVQHKYAEHLPFVCYKPPYHTSVILLQQEDDTLIFLTLIKKNKRDLFSLLSMLTNLLLSSLLTKLP